MVTQKKVGICSISFILSKHKHTMLVAILELNLCGMVLPDRMEATAAMTKDKMTPGPAISLATSPATTYMPVPTQLPTPSDTRSTVVSTRASLVPCRSAAPSCIDSTGLVRSMREWRPYQEASHSTCRGSSLAKMELIFQLRSRFLG